MPREWIIRSARLTLHVCEVRTVRHPHAILTRIIIVISSQATIDCAIVSDLEERFPCLWQRRPIVQPTEQRILLVLLLLELVPFGV